LKVRKEKKKGVLKLEHEAELAVLQDGESVTPNSRGEPAVLQFVELCCAVQTCSRVLNSEHSVALQIWRRPSYFLKKGGDGAINLKVEQ
jgi:hypothetical protein